MSRTACLATLVLVCTLTPARPAAPPPAAPAAEEIAKLIEQLGDRSYVVREAAERRLVATGVAALPQLKKALGHREIEVRRRILRLLPGLEMAGMVNPKRLSLVVKNMPLNDVLNEISKQTGYKIQNQSGFMGRRVPGKVGAEAKATDDKFTYTMLNATFWEVMDAVCRDSGLTVQTGYGDDIIRLYNNGSGTGRPYGGVNGAFRYVATNMQMQRNIDLTNGGDGSTPPARSESLTFNFQITGEPRLPFLGMGEPRLEAAYDSERNSLVPPTTGFDEGGFIGKGFGRARYYSGGYKQASLSVGLNLRRVSEKATSIKTLKAIIPVQLLVEQKPVVLSEKILSAGGTKVSAGDIDFHVEEVKKAGNQFTIKFTATNKNAGGDYNWMNTIYQRLELTDAKGNKFQNYGTNWHNSGGNNVTMTLTYSNQGLAAGGDPVKFVFMQWVTRQHELEVEFKDVPLP